MNDDLKRRLDDGLQKLADTGIAPVDAAQRSQLLALVALLSKWNKVYNLTAVREPIQMIDRHLLDSLVMSRWLPSTSAIATPVAGGAADLVSSDDAGAVFDVMDVGTGAGLPVLPLAIVRSDLQFLSVESNGKKTRFQQQALMELGMGNVTVVHERVENLTESAHLVLSRAFTAPGKFLALADSLCAPKGSVAIMLGQAERMPARLPDSFELVELQEVDVPGTESARHVALCRRRAG